MHNASGQKGLRQNDRFVEACKSSGSFDRRHFLRRIDRIVSKIELSEKYEVSRIFKRNVRFSLCSFAVDVEAVLSCKLLYELYSPLPLSLTAPAGPCFFLVVSSWPSVVSHI
jgi:hypothetical protein